MKISFKKYFLFLFLMFFYFCDASYSGIRRKSRKQPESLVNKFYNNGRPAPIVRDKYYTYYNVSLLGSGAIKNLTVKKDNCNYAVNDCIRKICKNREDLLKNSSYVYCSSNSVDTISNNIQSCLIDKDALEKTEYSKICQGSVVSLLYKYYDELEVMNSEFAKVSASCILAKDNLYAAEQCYFYSMGYNEDFDESNRDALQQLCGATVRGGSENMANQFFSAGMYGMSDIYSGSMKQVEPFSNPYKKRDNWKEVVQAIYDRYRRNMLSSCGGNIE